MSLERKHDALESDRCKDGKKHKWVFQGKEGRLFIYKCEKCKTLGYR